MNNANRTYDIFVSSQSGSGSPNSFNIDLGALQLGSNVRSYQIAFNWIHFLNSVTNVNQYNKYIYFNDTGGGGTLTATLTEGDYDSTTFPTEVETQLNAATALAASPYTATYDSTLGTFNINLAGGDTFELVSGANNAYTLMGFSSAGIGLGQATDYLSDGIMDLSGSKIMRLEISQLGAYGSNSVGTPAFDIIPLSSSFGFIQTYQAPNPIFKPIENVSLSQLTVRLVDENSNLFPLASNTPVFIHFYLKPIVNMTLSQ